LEKRCKFTAFFEVAKRIRDFFSFHRRFLLFSSQAASTC